MIARGLGFYLKIQKIKSFGYKEICAVALVNKNGKFSFFPINVN